MLRTTTKIGRSVSTKKAKDEDKTMPEKKQHVDINRKLKLRTKLLEKAGRLTGAFYIPFIGEGDIAVELYGEHKIFGADKNSTFVKAARKRLPKAEIITADCDQFPFKKGVATFSLADFDSYSYPYDSFRTFWKGAKIGSQCVLFFTDGQRQAIIGSGSYRTPDGERQKITKVAEKRKAFNFYFNQVVLPWFEEYIKPWKIVSVTKYLRNASMCYWGAIIAKPGSHNNHATHKGDKGANGERKPYKFDALKKKNYLEHISNGHTRAYAATLVGVHRSTVVDHMKADKEFAGAVSDAEGDALGKVVNALHEAAVSGNVTAIQVFLYNRDPVNWKDKRNIQLGGLDDGPVKVEIDAKGKLLGILNRLAKRAEEGKENANDK